MIEFEKEVTKLLPYDREQYHSFHGWYGISFQLEGGFEGKRIDFTAYIKKYEPWFKHVISRMDNGSNWIVNLDYDGAKWFPSDEHNLVALRTLFQQNSIANTFRGALILSKEHLLRFSRELISYPFTVTGKEGQLYNDLEISHGELPFVIKISAHQNIDLLSTDIDLLRLFLKEDAAVPFIIRAYQ